MPEALHPASPAPEPQAEGASWERPAASSRAREQSKVAPADLCRAFLGHPGAARLLPSGRTRGDQREIRCTCRARSLLPMKVVPVRAPESRLSSPVIPSRRCGALSEARGAFAARNPRCGVQLQPSLRSCRVRIRPAPEFRRPDEPAVLCVVPIIRVIFLRYPTTPRCRCRNCGHRCKGGIAARTAFRSPLSAV